MVSQWAFVTVLTSDSYLPGALVTAHSIKLSEKHSTRKFDLVCLVTLDTVSVQSIKALRQVYNLVVSVEEIRSTHSQHELNLLGRQDLASTITKIHIWRLAQYQKLIYLDSDTLLLRPISHLFEIDAPFSACPDIGWPDCFNSGLMVITPNTKTFEDIFHHFLAHGSWDGGDQGLLNDFFSGSSTESSATTNSDKSGGWNRLSFIYNVTPSAYYTYAPAYKRYGDKISMVHFIGSEKPWHLINRRRYRNVSFQSQRSPSLDAIDYDSLVDSWLDVYEKALGPVGPLESVPMESQFHVPKYISQWDSTQPSPYKPPTLEDLKDMFSRKRAQFAYDSWNQKAITGEAGYISLPFLDLSSIAQQYFDQKGAKSHLSRDHSPAPEENSMQSQLNSESGKNESHSVWDPSRTSPPTEGYQMQQPIVHRYESVWDKPFDEQARSFFQPPPITHSIPSVTHQDYSQFSTVPEPRAVKAVFPWENQARPKSGRFFPAGETNASGSSTHSHHQKSASTAINQGSLRDIYRNAWDEDPMIGRWAHARNFSASINIPNAGWGKLEEAKAALVRTPRLELKSLMGSQHGRSNVHGEKEDDVGRLHYFGHQSQRTLITSPSYQSERESEGSSHDADEEDVGDDEDQSSDNRNAMAEETGSEGTVKTPTDQFKSLDPNCYDDNNEKNEHTQTDLMPRIPTTRSVIVGVPVKISSPSSGPDNGQGYQSRNRVDAGTASAESLS